MKMSDEWIEVENEGNEDDNSEIWKPETVDESIQGVYVDIEPDTGIDGNSILYHVKNDEEYWKIWGTTVLNSKMEKIEVGSKVKIVYLGKKKGKSGNYYKDFKVLYQKGGEPSGSSSSSMRGHDKHTMEKAEQDNSDEPEILDIVHEQEKTVEVARGWLNKITNDMIGEQLTVNEKTLKVEVYRLSQIPAHDKELGYLEDEMAREVFKLIDKRG